jgi:hypothetical protein
MELLTLILLQHPATSFFSFANVFSTLFSFTFNLCSCLSMRHRILHLYTITGKIIVLCSLIVKFWESKREDRLLWTK